MDTLTHIVVGACIGEIVAGKQLGKKALILGALAQNIPDIDFVASFWLPTASDLLAHRGFTHSILFAVIMAPLLALLSVRLFRKDKMLFKDWAFFWGLQILIHLFIDVFNAYGTGLFEPFSHYRVSFNTMYVADPLVSIWPAIALIALLIMKAGNTRRSTFAWTALAISGSYLLLGIVFKQIIDSKVEKDLRLSHLSFNRYLTTPTPLNNLLWYVVAENDSGYYTGYRSVLDTKETIDFRYVHRNSYLLNEVANKQDVEKLTRFSQGYYTVDRWHDTLVFCIPRFGEITGWNDTNARFAFYYFLQYPDNNKLCIQRGRFAHWDKMVFLSFIHRIQGI